MSQIPQCPNSLIGTEAGYIVISAILPILAIIGINPNHPITAPANIYPEIFFPIINPTPNNAGITSIPIAAPSKPFIVVSISPSNKPKPLLISLYKAPIPKPVNVALAFIPPSSPANNTSAQAVPSGYGKTPCSFTINAFLSGTIKNTPNNPPQSAIATIVK